MRNIFGKYHAENEGWRLIPDLFLFVNKKRSGIVKFQTVDPEIWTKSCFPYTNAQLWWTLVNMLNFDFLETVLGLFSAPYFLHDFCMICAWTNLIALWKKRAFMGK